MSGGGVVGPVLEPGEVADAIVRVLRVDHPELTVEDRGSYLRVSCKDRCVLRAAAVSEVLGRPFRLPVDLELVMPSFKGVIRLSEEEVRWTSSREP